MMRFYALTDVGKVRPLNEDGFYLPRQGERFCAVADGMGGHNAGEIASAMALECFSSWMRFASRPNGSALHEAVRHANRAVYEESLRDTAKEGMGTTFTALSIEGETVHIAHVGDSRAYIIRGDSIMRLTMDHTVVEQLVLQGVITAKEARVHPQRNLITRALGTSEHLDIDILHVDVFPGDVLLLCTDGLSKHVEEYEMLRITNSTGTWEEKLRALIDVALADGGTDNITALYAVYGEDKA